MDKYGVDIRKLIWAKNKGEAYYNLLLKKYIRENKKVLYMDPNKLMWAVDMGLCLYYDMTGSYLIEGQTHVPIDLAILAERFRKYYSIHKSKSAKEAWLILIANKETVFVVVNPVKNKFINSN